MKLSTFIFSLIFALSPFSVLEAEDTAAKVDSSIPSRASATFAGGCFWCMEHPFEKLDGVLEVTSGYTGGTTEHPDYKEVSAGTTGHYEAVKVIYDPDIVTYAELLTVFWRNIDPTDGGGQFCDRGDQYRAAIFTHTDQQKTEAQASRAALQINDQISKPIKTEILESSTFYPAEPYHQDYSKRNPTKYKYYRWRCGRDSRLKELWGE